MRIQTIVSILSPCLLVIATMGSRSYSFSPQAISFVNTPGTAIILPSQPTACEKHAVEELAAYLGKMCGTAPECKTWNPAPAQERGMLFLGNAALLADGISAQEMKDVTADGYRLKIAKGNIYITGHDDRGTLYGVYDVLHRMGARFYANQMEEIPARSTIVLAPTNEIRNPALEMRLIDSDCVKHGEHNLRTDMGNPYELDPSHFPATKYGWDHTSSYLVPFYLYGREHPEYFAQDAQGVRLAKEYLDNPNAPINTLHLCMSNPQVRKIATERLLDWIEKQKDRKFFAVTQSDGYGWCQCAKCKKLDTVPGQVTSDRLLFFVNELAEAVAKKYPDKILVTLAYTSFTGPAPTRIKPAPNVRVMYCPYPPETPCQGHGLLCEKNKVGYEWYKQWLAWCPGQLYIYDYPVSTLLALEFMHEGQIERIKMYARDGIKGIYFCGRPVFLRSLFDYVEGRLMWDPTLDAGRLTHQFMTAYFQEAGEEMFQFYNLCAEHAANPNVHQGAAADGLKFASVDLVRQALVLFRTAEEKAKNDAVIIKRLKQEKVYVLYSDLTQRNPIRGQMPDGLDAFAARLNEYVSIVRDRSITSFFNEQDPDRIKSWFYRIARLKITTSPWYDDPVLARLSENPRALFGEVVASLGAVEQLSEGRGWKIPLTLFAGGRGPEKYGWQCPPREAVWIYGTQTGENRLRATFKLDTIPTDPMRLVIEGQDQDKPGVTLIRITLNGVELFRGKNDFVKNDWSTKRYSLPPRVLKSGENELLIEDIEESGNYQAQWFMVAGVRFEKEGANKIAAPAVIAPAFPEVTTPVATTAPAAASEPRTLFLAHFDASTDADFAAMPLSVVRGHLRLHPEGKWGKALDLNYSADSTGSIQFEGLDNYNPQKGTFEMWFKPKWAPSDRITAPLVFIYGPSSTKTGFYLFKYETQKCLTLCIYNQTRQVYQGPPVTLCTSDLTFAANTWHHVAFTWNSHANIVQLFLDGVLVARQDNVLCGKEVADAISLGTLADGADNLAGVLIDEVRISDDVLWEGKMPGKKVFNVPIQPYSTPKK